MSSHRLDIQYPLHAAADEVVLILILFCADDPRDPFLDLRIQPSPLSVHQGDITGTWGGVNALGCHVGHALGTLDTTPHAVHAHVRGSSYRSKKELLAR